MKRWIIAGALSALGLLTLMVAFVLVGRFDAWQIAEAQAQGVSGGQFNGAGQEIMLWAFLWLLVASLVVGLAAFAIAALVKRYSRLLARLPYSSLLFWFGMTPALAFLLVFPAWALWGAVQDLHQIK